MNAALALIQARVAARPQAIDPTVARATCLWPDDPRNQREWIRAVGVVRATRNGWLLDRAQRRIA